MSEGAGALLAQGGLGNQGDRWAELWQVSRLFWRDSGNDPAAPDAE